MSAEVVYTPAQCMPLQMLPATEGRCKGCGASVLWGLTIKGKSAPFDAEEPHPNHFITCPMRESFRRNTKKWAP